MRSPRSTAATLKVWLVGRAGRARELIVWLDPVLALRPFLEP